MCMVAVLPPNDGREAADRRCANAELGALHGAVRSRTRVRLEQAPARRWNSSDFCRDYPSHFHEVDSRSWFFLGTDLFAGWANLGRKRSMDVPNRNSPRADLGRYPTRQCNKVVALAVATCSRQI